MSSLFGSIRIFLEEVVRFTYFDILFLNSCTFIYSRRYNLEPIHVYLLHTLLDYTVIVICKGRELWLSPSRTSHQTLARFAELWVPADQPGRGGVRAVLGQPGGEVHHDLRMVHGPLVCSGHLLLGIWYTNNLELCSIWGIITKIVLSIFVLSTCTVQVYLDNDVNITNWLELMASLYICKSGFYVFYNSYIRLLWNSL